VTLASILSAHWLRFVATHRHLLTRAHYRAAAAVLACRTSVLGAQVYRCGDCAKVHFAYHSCNHRACPQCGGHEQAQWTAAQEAKLLPVRYFMLTFTLPEQLRRVAYQQQAWFYDAMFVAVSSTLNAFARDARHLGGTPGFTAVLHTWTRQMQFHPHLHVIMPGVVLSADGLRLHRAKGRKYLFPIRALGTAFRHRLMKLILARDKTEGTRHHRQIDPHVWRIRWNVYSRAVGNGQPAVRYLARYVAKTALSEQRLLGYDPKGNVRLNCQSSATGEWSVITLKPDEFLRRWSLHILPKGLMRVRHYGFLSAAAKAKLERLRQILGVATPPAAPPSEAIQIKCACCGEPMRLVGRLEPLALWKSAYFGPIVHNRGPPQNNA
jgi:hypothetical protein